MQWILAVRSIASVSAVLALCSSLECASAQAVDGKVVRPVEDFKFEARPDGSSMAIISGDPGSGPSVILMKVKSGAIPMHWHPSGYSAVVVQGTMKHWGEGGQEATSPPLRPGSYWFQPAKVVEGDACVDVSGECMIYEHNLGKMGFTPAASVKK
jgi:quercetin dioxygenase-like cupin family protein